MRLLAFFVAFSFALPAAERLTATGTITDEATGQPVANATVMVYSAGVRTGYDQFCPTCYVDCGKRATTDRNGAFTIAELSGDLVFDLLVIGEGYAPTWLRKVDPAKGAAPSLALKARSVPETAQIGRGRVVDATGEPVRDAVVSQQGIIWLNGRSFGTRDWIDVMAITNRLGEFELAYNGQPAKSMIVEVAPRGMAPKLSLIPTGGNRQTITVREGASVRGRLVHDGKPVANAQFLLSSHSRAAGTTYPEVRIGTNENGEFVITNVPAGRIWNLAPVMDSLAPKNLTAGAIFVATKDDGEEVKVPDIAARPAHTLRGRIVLSDGSPIPSGMRLSLFGGRSSDRQTVMLPPDGAYEFKGLGKGVYTFNAAVKGYQRYDPETPSEILIEGNRDGFNVTLYPVKVEAK